MRPFTGTEGEKTAMAPRDQEAEGWERSDMPIVCQSCLGPNPYVQMKKAYCHKECKICTRPFTVFKWRPGRDAREKKTEICQTCCKIKNVCQVCILDLEYGLPVQVRDTALNCSTESFPRSDVNRMYLVEERSRQDRDGIEYKSSFGKALSNALLKIQRTEPCYGKNWSHVCSFYGKGGCKSGVECPYRHERPVNGELSKQNLRDRYYGNNDPVALKLMSRAGLMPDKGSPQATAHAMLPQQQNLNSQQVGHFNIPPPMLGGMDYPSMDPERMGALRGR